MKYVSFLIFFLSIGKNLYAQIDTLYYNSKWEATKDTLYDYRLIIDKTNADDNYKTFFKSGEVKSSFSCSDMNLDNLMQSKFHATYKEFAKNGTITCQGEYDKGLKTGLWSYFFENGERDYEENYENGQLNGPFTSYFENGEIFEKGSFLDGNKHQFWITKYNDGSIMSVENYQKGIRNPLCQECNEYQKCKVVIFNDFNVDSNQYSWFSSDSTRYTRDKSGLLVSFSKEKKDDFYIDINLPWKNYDDFSFEATFVNTNNSTLQYGLSWNETEIENTSSQFLIANTGVFSIDNVEDDVFFKNKVEKSTNIITEINGENKLKITKKGEVIYYSINGVVVETQNFPEFMGRKFKIILFPNENSSDASLIIKDFTFKDSELYEDVEYETGYRDTNWKVCASGFFVDKEGFIATNYHVVDTAKEIWVKCYKNGEYKKYKAIVSLFDKYNDLAILKITDSTFVPMAPLPYKIATESLALGNEVFTLGFPLADVMGETVKYTDGKVSSLTAVKDQLNKYQISTPIQQGNSGGPLFDNHGNVVGVIVSKLNRDAFKSENVNYAIKSLFLKNIMDLVPINLENNKKKKNTAMSREDSVKLYSDYVVIVQVF